MFKKWGLCRRSGAAGLPEIVWGLRVLVMLGRRIEAVVVGMRAVGFRFGYGIVRGVGGGVEALEGCHDPGDTRRVTLARCEVP